MAKENISVDKETGCVVLRLKESIYSLSTIYAAGYAFLDKAYIIFDSNKKGEIEIYLYPKKSGLDLKKIGLDFYEELLNYAHYFMSAQANAEVIKLIMQRVLFSTAPSVVKEEVKEQEDKELDELIKELEEEEGKEERK